MNTSVELAKVLGDKPASEANLRQLYTAAAITGLLANDASFREHIGIAIETAEAVLIKEVEKGYLP